MRAWVFDSQEFYFHGFVCTAPSEQAAREKFEAFIRAQGGTNILGEEWKLYDEEEIEEMLETWEPREVPEEGDMVP